MNATLATRWLDSRGHTGRGYYIFLDGDYLYLWRIVEGVPRYETKLGEPYCPSVKASLRRFFGE